MPTRTVTRIERDESGELTVFFKGSEEPFGIQEFEPGTDTHEFFLNLYSLIETFRAPFPKSDSWELVRGDFDFSKPLLSQNKWGWYCFHVVMGEYLEPGDEKSVMLFETEAYKHMTGHDACIIRVPNNWGFLQLVWWLGFFESKRDATRNGWNKSIPEGVTDIKVGKRGRLLICNASKLTSTHSSIWTPDVEAEFDAADNDKQAVLLARLEAEVARRA